MWGEQSESRERRERARGRAPAGDAEFRRKRQGRRHLATWRLGPAKQLGLHRPHPTPLWLLTKFYPPALTLLLRSVLPTPHPTRVRDSAFQPAGVRVKPLPPVLGTPQAGPAPAPAPALTCATSRPRPAPRVPAPAPRPAARSGSRESDPRKSLEGAALAAVLRALTMTSLTLLILSSLLCWVSADIRCHSCYKVPVLGCMDRQSCRLEPGQKCLTTNVYLGRMWLYSNLRCGTPEEPCLEAFNKTVHKLGLNYNTTCCERDNCNNPAPRPTPTLALVFLTSLAGLGLWLLH